MPKPLTVWITINWKILKEMGIPDHLICLFTAPPARIPGSQTLLGSLGARRRFGPASLAAQMVKNPPAVRETWVRSLG